MSSGPQSGADAATSATATAQDEPQIELIGVRKVFSGRGSDAVVAVDGADLTVYDGELFAILGPSGSGKTTVLRMIAGFEEPTEGAIRLGGVDVTSWPARKRDVNTVFQEYALFPHMTVEQNVEYGMKVRGVPKTERRRRTAEALDMVRLTDQAPRQPAQLSGGQRQRVALARALVGRPRVLLLDEPLGALDLKLREQMQVELKAIQREVGITFIIVTHDQDEALTLCDRLAVFNHGRIEQVGKARDVYEYPANRFVADFVGTSNVLDGEAARRARRPAGSVRGAAGTDRGRRGGRRRRAGHPQCRRHRGRSHLRRPHHTRRRRRRTGRDADRDRAQQCRTAARRPRPRRARSPCPGPRTPFTTCPTESHEERPMKSTAIRLGLAMTACAVLVSGMVTACSGSKPANDSGTAPPKMEPLGSLGNGEGQLNLIAWAGYAENGSNDPKVDWVTPFEKESGCKVNVKVGNTSDEMVQLMRTGQYDGVSASGDATLRLIYAGDVAPVNTSLVPNYASISSFLKDKPWNSVDGQMYGIPHGWGANLLMYNIGVVHDAPDSWGAVFGDAGKYKGKVTAYDSPIYIADAALYLSKTKPELGIKDPYSLTSAQLDAAVELLKAQKENISEYWSDYTKEVQAFESGTVGDRHDVAGDRQHHRHRQQGPGEHRDPEGGIHRLVGHLDGRRRRPPIPTACTSGWTGSPRRRSTRRWPSTSVRRPPRRRRANSPPRRTSATSTTPPTRATPRRSTTGPPRRSTASTAVVTTARPTTSGSTSGSRSRGDGCRPCRTDQEAGFDVAAGRLRRSPTRLRRLSLAFLLVPPLAWLTVAYLGSLAVLLVSAFWTTNSFTGAVVHTLTGDNITRVLTDEVFRAVTLRTVGVAAVVTVPAPSSRCPWRCTWPRSPPRGCDWRSWWR